MFKEKCKNLVSFLALFLLKLWNDDDWNLAIIDLFFFENKRIKIFTSAKKCVLGGDFSPKPFGAFFCKTKNFDPLGDYIIFVCLFVSFFFSYMVLCSMHETTNFEICSHDVSWTYFIFDTFVHGVVQKWRKCWSKYKYFSTFYCVFDIGEPCCTFVIGETIPHNTRHNHGHNCHPSYSFYDFYDNYFFPFLYCSRVWISADVVCNAHFDDKFNIF